MEMEQETIDKSSSSSKVSSKTLSKDDASCIDNEEFYSGYCIISWVIDILSGE